MRRAWLKEYLDEYEVHGQTDASSNRGETDLWADKLSPGPKAASSSIADAFWAKTEASLYHQPTTGIPSPSAAALAYQDASSRAIAYCVVDAQIPADYCMHTRLLSIAMR